MKHRFTINPRKGRRAALTTVGAAGLLIAGLVSPAASDASGLSTSTAVTASPSSTTVGNAVTIKATVKVLGLNGLGVTPTGSVQFTSKNSAGATAPLGSAVLSPCLLSSCVATLTTTAVPLGTVSVTGTYGGDGLSGPSAGSTALKVAANPTPGTATAVTCYSGQTCDTGTLVSSDNTTKLDVLVAKSANAQTVTASLGSGTLHCVAGGTPDNDADDDDGVFVGALATFSSTATDAGKTITYTGTGATGQTMNHQYTEHTQYAGCYASPNPFKGYTNGVYGPAPLIAADGLYEAMLSNCANNSGALPCVTNSFTPSTGTDSYIIKAPAGDPKVLG
jgi:Bacterial Ig-like domain (group 3)